MTVRKAAFAVAGVAAYLALIYLANAPYYVGLEPFWIAELWNYGVAAALLGLIHLATLRVKRPLPALPRDLPAVWWLVGILLVVAGLTTLFWIAVTTHWGPLFRLLAPDHLIGARLGLPSDVVDRLDNVVGGGLLLTLVATGLSLWRVRRHGAIGFRFGWLDFSLGFGLIIAWIAGTALRAKLFSPPVQPYVLLPVSLWALPLFLLQMLVNGLQEETLFRGYVLPQLAALLRRPWLAMLVMIVLFDAMHLPSMIIGQGMPWRPVVLDLLLPAQPFALVVGYAYWRSRSLVPGILLHTYTTLWSSFLFL